MDLHTELNFEDLSPDTAAQLRRHFAEIIVESMLSGLDDGEARTLGEALKTKKEDEVYTMINDLVATKPELAATVQKAMEDELAVLQSAHEALKAKKG